MYVATSRARAKENDAGTDGRLLRVLDLFRRREILYASRDRRCVTKITYGSTLIRVRTIFNLPPRKVPAKGPRELFQVRRRSLRRAQSKVALPPARRNKGRTQSPQRSGGGDGLNPPKKKKLTRPLAKGWVLHTIGRRLRAACVGGCRADGRRRAPV